MSPTADELGPVMLKAPPCDKIVPEIPDGALALHPTSWALCVLLGFLGLPRVQSEIGREPGGPLVPILNMHRKLATRSSSHVGNVPRRLRPALLCSQTGICSMRRDTLWRVGLRIWGLLPIGDPARSIEHPEFGKDFKGLPPAKPFIRGDADDPVSAAPQVCSPHCLRP